MSYWNSLVSKKAVKKAAKNGPDIVTSTYSEDGDWAKHASRATQLLQSHAYEKAAAECTKMFTILYAERTVNLDICALLGAAANAYIMVDEEGIALQALDVALAINPDLKTHRQMRDELLADLEADETAESASTKPRDDDPVLPVRYYLEWLNSLEINLSTDNQPVR